MYILTWDIRIGKYSLKTLKEVKITTSVLNLSDTAVIALPGQYFNHWKKIEDKIHVNDPVEIKLGYDGENETEFTGYLKRISRDNNSLTLECEDSLYLLRHIYAPDGEYKKISVKELLEKITLGGFTIKCDYDFTYDKFVIFHQTALDVLKKLHDDTKANIWFDGNTLHLHPVYDTIDKVSGDKPIIYDTKKNIQSNELKWVDEKDKKVEIEVVCVKKDGTKTSEKYGNSGGVKAIKYIGSSSETNLMDAARDEYKLWNYSGFEGDFTGWLVPRTKAGGCVRLRDENRNTEGTYYVTGVEIEFGQSGAKRKVTLGRLLSD